ncbi:DUF4961 domain-containing protein [Mucilaginibacter sp. CSA2-8R]|uniref:DUF4961 domain-containing protein n=1 Tax=Mucilaginibacter sp. CSA2-8R TaxID=3141542 RepID=UPI00315CC348
MMTRIHISRQRFIKYFSLALILFVLANCTATIDSIIQPLSAKVNDVISVKLNTTFQADATSDPQTIIVGILAPKSWKLGQGGNTAVTISSVKGDGTLSLMPSSNIAAGAVNGENWATRFKNRFGIGPNYIDDMEWVVFRTDARYVGNGGERIATVFNIKMKVGVDNKNTTVKLGYVICNETNGVNPGDENVYWNVKYTDCMSVTGGKGDLVDFCNPALTILTPAKVLDNEYVSILFDNTIISTKLTGSDNTYLCATAHTTDNQDIVVCSQDDKTKMIKVADNKYSITLWPKGYFKVPDGKTLASIDYYITDKTGAIKVGYANTNTPFKLTFTCE